MAADPPAAPQWRLLGALGVGQILGWGATYFLPGVLGGPIEAALGLPAGAAFLGSAVVLLVAGALAPAVGRRVDAVGARPVMVAGSAALAAGLALLALAEGPWLGLLACLVMGVGGALALSEPAQAAIAALGAAGVRRRLTLLALMSGMGTIVAWPALAAAEAAWGWRGAVLAAAAAQLLVALPLHLLCLPALKREAPRPAALAGPLPRRLRLLSAAMTLQVLVGSAVLANLVGLIEALGLDRAAAILWASLIGPVQVAARALDLAGGGRIAAVRLTSVALAVAVPALLLPLAAPGAVPAFILLYGLAGGIMTVMRPACLIELHGTEGYATVAGRVMAPVMAAMAVGPALLAPLLHHAGPTAALLAAAAGMAGALLLLRRALRAR